MRISFEPVAARAVLATAVMALASCASLPAGKPIEGPVAIGQTAYVDGPQVTPLVVLEDSRCPVGVQCVWTGQVRVKVRVTGGGWSKELELNTRENAPVADGALRLVMVTPERREGRAIAPKDYRFTFRFDGGL